MTKIYFHNTKTRQKELFNPIQPDKVSMYHCGPTVYNQAHLGNLTPYIYWDIMRRLFEAEGYQVIQVMNFTDIGHIVADQDQGDDKMVSALINSGKELNIKNLHEHGKEVANQYLADMSALNILTPHHLPYASQHITEDITIIQKIIDQDFAYIIEGDAIYFDTSKLSNYDYFDVHGDLNEDYRRTGHETKKKSPRDFSLWKFSDEGSEIGWDSPWGKGFPGWHIECSAMSWRYLGESFDIHTGGIEHIPVHHTNEIAQSETAFGKTMAAYWLHNNHLQLNGEKISKSEGNVRYLDELEANGFSPADFRYLILTSHYRSEQNLTSKSLLAAQAARISLYKSFNTPHTHEYDKSTFVHLLEILGNDLDTPASLAAVRTILKNNPSDLERQAALHFTNSILGIDFSDLTIQQNESELPLPEEVQEIVQMRQQARIEKNFELADQLRNKLHELGYSVTDNSEGQEVSRN